MSDPYLCFDSTLMAIRRLMESPSMTAASLCVGDKVAKEEISENHDAAMDTKERI